MGYTKNYNSTYSEDYYRNLLADEPLYVESQEAKAAEQKLASAESNVPKNTYKGTYAQDIAHSVNNYLAQNTYNYTPSQDDYYQQYRDIYMEGAKQAETDSVNMGQRLSGGFDNSYGKAVGNEVAGEYIGDVNNAYETYDNFAQSRYLNDRASQLQQIEFLESLDNTEYVQGRDKVADYFNFLNYYNQKYETARGLDLTNFQNEWQIYATKLAAAQSDYQFNKSYDESNRQFNESMNYNYSALAESNRQAEKNLEYTKEYDAYKAMEKQAEKETGETKRANALLATMNLEDLKDELTGTAVSYNTYVSDEIEKMLDEGRIDASEATYMLTKAGVLQEADDYSFDTQNADAFMITFGLADETGNVIPKSKWNDNTKSGWEKFSNKGSNSYENYVNHALTLGRNHGSITDEEETYIREMLKKQS